MLFDFDEAYGFFHTIGLLLPFAGRAESAGEPRKERRGERCNAGGLPRERERRAGFLMRRARGIIYTLGMLLMMILSFVLGGFGQQIKALVEKYLPGSQSFFSFLLHFLLQA